MAQLAITLFGPLHVMLKGIALTSFGYDKVRALLAYIAVEGAHPLSRTALAELLWPDQPSGVARTNLRHALAVLRRAIGDSSATPFLLVSRDTLQLNSAADCTVDVTTFTTLINACATCRHPPDDICTACVERLTQAVALYHGDFMALFSLPDSADFDEWALVLRERLHEQAADALAQLTAHHQRCGDLIAARELAQRWAQHSRWDEEAHRCLMRLYERAGQRGAALAQFERCRRMLVDELGITPATETVALYEAIRSGQLADSQVAGISTGLVLSKPAAQRIPQPVVDERTATLSAKLPVPPNALIGRERELAELMMLLHEPATRLVTLTGPPGVGKTRLALATAYALASDNSFPDGVFFVPLAPVQDAALVVTAIIYALELREVIGRAANRLLANFFHDKRALLVLDNLEQIVAVAPTLAELLTAAPGLVMLVTSRVLLHLSNEHEYLVEPLGLPGESTTTLTAHQARSGHPPSPPSLPFAEIAASPAVQLFVARARAAWSGFTIDQENGWAIAALCAHLDGLPLAIELAAVRARMLRPVELLERLRSIGGLNALGHGPLDAPARQQTLHQAIAWSYDLLSPTAQSVFRRLGVFVGGWSLDAAEYVCGNIGEQSILDLVGTLIDHSLIQVAEAPGGELRFSMLETLREFALEQLTTIPGALEQVCQCHAVYFGMLAQALEQQLYTARDSAALRRLEAEASNLYAVLTWALTAGKPSTQAELALWPVRGLFWLWSHHGPVAEGRLWLARVLNATSGNPQTYPRILALLSAGWLSSFSDDTTTAEQLATQALTCAREYGQANLVFGALWLLSDIRLASDLECAAALADEGLALAPQLDVCHQGIALFHRASIAMFADDIERSLALFDQALIHLRRVGALFWLGEALMCLAIVLRFQGEAAQARAHAEECLALMRQLGSRRNILVMLRNLVLLARITGDYAAAEAYASELLSQARDLGEPGMIAEDGVYPAIVAFEQGEYAQAQMIADQSLTLGREAQSPFAIAMARWMHGMLALAHGDIPAADWVTECLEQARSANADWPLLMAHSLAGLAASAQGNHAAARALLEARLTQREARINRWERAEGLADLGQALLNAGERTQSAACLSEALAIYRIYGSKQRIAQTIDALARTDR